MTKPTSVLTLALSLLCGCSQSFYYLGDALPEGIESTAKGQSLAQVMAVMGPPQRLSATATGYVMGWEYWRVTEQSIGLSLRAIGADALSVDWGDATVSGDFVVMNVNHEREVTDVWRASWDTDVADAASIQALFALAPDVSVDDLLIPLPAHSWGDSLLLPIPQALNNASRPDMGTTGIEQRGTPYGIGQKSLELE